MKKLYDDLKRIEQKMNELALKVKYLSLKTEKETIDTFSWRSINKIWRFYARDKDNKVYVYSCEPFIVKSTNRWYCKHGECIDITNLYFLYLRGTCNWKHSLISRKDDE